MAQTKICFVKRREVEIPQPPVKFTVFTLDLGDQGRIELSVDAVHGRDYTDGRVELVYRGALVATAFGPYADELLRILNPEEYAERERRAVMRGAERRVLEQQKAAFNLAAFNLAHPVAENEKK